MTVTELVLVLGDLECAHDFTMWHHNLMAGAEVRYCVKCSRKEGKFYRGDGAASETSPSDRGYPPADVRPPQVPFVPSKDHTETAARSKTQQIRRTPFLNEVPSAP